jgi:hypothetical protein
MLTLAHAHGTLLSLIHVAFGVTLHVFSMDDANLRWARLASSCLLGASVLLPGGFFLAGFFIYGGDPGLGIFLVPVGALLLFVGILTTAWQVTTAGGSA